VATGRRLTSQGAERRRQLLDCAAELFADRGFADTRVVDIVRAAGVAKGLFYWYFENKEALFKELVEDIRHRLRVAQGQGMDRDADPLVRIRQGTEASVRFVAQHAHLYALLRAESLDRGAAKLMRAGTDVHADDTAALVRAGIDAGLIRDEDPRMLAFGVLGLVAYYSHFHRTGRIDTPVDELAAFVGRLVVRALAVDDEVAARASAPHPAPPPQVRAVAGR
jgi:AcrR family transcriptional regulator